MPCKRSIPPEIIIRPEKSLDTAQVQALYQEAGWIGPEDDTAFIVPMLKNSFAVMAAFAGNGRLVGMMRALSDGVSDAYLLDLIVTKEYRRQGIGKAILDALRDHLAGLGIDWIVCIGADGTEPFYRETNAQVMEGHIPYRFYTKKGKGQN